MKKDKYKWHKLPRSAKGEAGLTCLFERYKNRCKTKNIKFTLTKEQFKKLTSSNCYYDKSKPSQKCTSHRVKTKATREFGTYTYNGIDRLNSNKGYIISNCVPCCWKCNTAKNTMSVRQFRNWVKKTYKNWISNV